MKTEGPLIDAGHVRNALARFDQVHGVTVDEASWRDLGARPHTKNPSH